MMMQPAAATYMIILPHIVLASGAVVVLLLAAFATARTVFFATLSVLCLDLLSLKPVLALVPAACTDLISLDSMTVFVVALLLAASLSIALLSWPYLKQQPNRRSEFFVLLLLSTLGAVIVASSSHFLSLFLGIELVGIPLAVLAAYPAGRERSVEAGFKYLLLAGVSSAVMLFGMALLYSESGSLLFRPVIAMFGKAGIRPLAALGLTLLLAGMSFKLALVPFHFWAPDIYEGAPAPIAAFAATVSKTAVIAALMRVFPPTVIARSPLLVALFSVIALASMVLGTILAVRQRNVKRLLAWSSISHNGSLLIAFLATGPLAYATVLFYLAYAVVTNLASFGGISVLSGPGGDAERLEDYAGLAWRKPLIASLFSLSLFSLLGVPLTAGFIAKFYLLAAGVESLRYTLVIALAATTGIAAYYYIRIVMTMFLGPRDIDAATLGHAEQRLSATGLAVLIVQGALIVVLGVAPQYLIGLIERMIL